ncbi:hypothetical protein AB0M46_39095 [Dactylosporangium sp. NPDC051485]|uniref:hypothetical protein n=1 Tax=Dactylosporangium sp. NPDC051485 TaxID=3154846 RepID=UPI003449BB9F
MPPAGFQSAAAPVPGGPPNSTAVFGAPPPVPVPPHGAPPVPGRSGGRLGLLVGVVAVLVLLLGAGGVAAYRAVSNDKTSDSSANRGSSGGNGGNTRGSGGSGSTAGANSGGQAANTKDAKPGAKQQSVQVGKSVWFAQYKITVNKMTYDADASQHKLSAEVVVENLSTANATPYLPIVFSIGGQQYTGSLRESSTVAAGQKSNYNLDFSIYDPLTAGLATGQLIFGGGEVEQPTIPLDGSAVNAYEPVNLLKDKKVTVHDVTATFTTCDLRGGFFDYNGQAKKGYRAVMCKVDIQYTGNSSLYVGQEHFRLAAPDGSELGPLTAPNEALSGGQVAVGDPLAFQVKADLLGTYKLRLVDLGGHKDRQPGDVAEIDLVLK